MKSRSTVRSDIITAIQDWAHARNIIKGGTAQAQFLKLAEEAGELDGAWVRGVDKEIIDGVGDVFVVLTILSAQANINFGEITYDVDNSHGDPLPSAIQALAAIGAGLARNDREKLTRGIWEMALYIEDRASSIGRDWLECAEAAYQEIKDRKGIMYKGCFIKESDTAAYEAACKEVFGNGQ